MPKVAINSVSPDFELSDYNGKKIRLSDYKSKSNVLLVFNRGFM